jgi:hypothetical protein
MTGIAFSLVLAVLASAPNAESQASPTNSSQKKTVEQGEFDYIGVPTTFGELVARSPLIARVRVTSAQERGYQIHGARSTAVRTDVSGQVLEIFKSDDRTTAPGQQIHILYPAVASGVDVGDVIVKQKGFRALDAGDEYFLFLIWNPAFEAYDIRWGPTGTYLVKGSRVTAFDTHSAVSRVWNGRPALEMPTAIRQAVQ